MSQPAALLAIAEHEAVDLTVVGPELPLSHGVADLFALAARPIVGPTGPRRRLESSKAFAADFMARHHVPTARYRVCASAVEARDVVTRAELGYPVVIKADGLAAGKGVVIADDRRSAPGHYRRGDGRAPVRRGGRPRRARGVPVRTGSVLLRLIRRPFVVPMSSAQDHKRIFDGDKGPNTWRHGCLRTQPATDAGARASGDRSGGGSRDRRDGGGGHAVRRFPLRGPDAHRAGAESHRVQRSGSAIRKRRSCCRCWKAVWPSC